MKLNHIIQICDALEVISQLTSTDNVPDIIEALEGVAFSEEEASEIRYYFTADPNKPLHTP